VLSFGGCFVLFVLVGLGFCFLGWGGLWVVGCGLWVGGVLEVCRRMRPLHE
jgi:hypothetical protein